MAPKKETNQTEKKELGRVQPQEITQEMQEAYLDYAMSVIVGRALPDVRDGLKPVHRRILYAMWDLGLRAGAKFRKSATVVGEVLGKYHPHGDVAVYDSMVRLAQDFSMRYPLVFGQGNFGSMDGDAAAAMRYTEAKMAAIAEEMLTDIEKETVNFIDNYDGSRQEPTVLPARLPQLLLNGSVGIAVGMATYIPPHNLTEVVNATIALIDRPKTTGEDLLAFIKGPDFPTGGQIYDKKALAHAYATGRGPVVVRAKAEIVEDKKGRFQIIVSEIPYQVNKASLLEKMAELVKTKKVDGIKDLRDESDREGVRVVVDLKNDAYPQKILNRLFKLTDLQKTFHFNMVALTDNGLQPQVLSLKNIIEHYLRHRQEVVERRTRFELEKAKERAHILQGLKKALDHIDQVIAVIKKSATKEIAQQNLISKFKLSERQATAILEMKLQTLAGLERKKIDDELKEKKKLIAYLQDLLQGPKKILGVVKKELTEIKQKYGDERKTRVFASPVGEFKEEDLIPNEECIITMTKGGYVKRMNPKNYRAQRRGGKGLIGMATREADAVDYLFTVSTHDNLLFFTNSGKVFQVRAYEIPESSRVAKGQAIVNFLQLATSEAVTTMVAVRQNKKEDKQDEGFKKDKFLVMATKNGIIKKTPLADFANVRRNGLNAIRLQKDDTLSWARISEGTDEIMVITRSGQSIRFSEKDVRPMGRTAAGVRAIRLKKDDWVVGMGVIPVPAGQKQLPGELLMVSENGYGKRTALKLFKRQRRGGSGLRAASVTKKTGALVSAFVLDPQEEDLIIISAKGQIIRTPIASVSSLGRATQGVRVMKINTGDQVVAVTTI